MDLLFSSNDWQPIYAIYYLNQQISQIEKGRQRFDNDLVTDVKYNVENTYMIKLVYDSHAFYNHQFCNAMYSFNLKTLTSAYKTSKSQEELIVSNNKTLDDIISTIDLWKNQIIGDLK